MSFTFCLWKHNTCYRDSVLFITSVGWVFQCVVLAVCAEAISDWINEDDAIYMWPSFGWRLVLIHLAFCKPLVWDAYLWRDWIYCVQLNNALCFLLLQGHAPLYGLISLSNIIVGVRVCPCFSRGIMTCLHLLLTLVFAVSLGTPVEIQRPRGVPLTSKAIYNLLHILY